MPRQFGREFKEAAVRRILGGEKVQALAEVTGGTASGGKTKSGS